MDRNFRFIYDLTHSTFKNKIKKATRIVRKQIATLLLENKKQINFRVQYKGSIE